MWALREPYPARPRALKLQGLEDYIRCPGPPQPVQGGAQSPVRTHAMESHRPMPLLASRRPILASQ